MVCVGVRYHKDTAVFARSDRDTVYACRRRHLCLLKRRSWSGASVESFFLKWCRMHRRCWSWLLYDDASLAFGPCQPVCKRLALGERKPNALQVRQQAEPIHGKQLRCERHAC